MKTAQDFLVDFTHKGELPKGGTIVLRECEPGNSNDPNWVWLPGKCLTMGTPRLWQTCASNIRR
jgi:hypothetical protein